LLSKFSGGYRAQIAWFVAASIPKIPNLPTVAPYRAIRSVPFGKTFALEFFNPVSVINSSVE
jgi:hypothetical protein